MTEPLKIAFLGLGVMGAPMAGHLARAGHQVTVWNRTPAKAEAWIANYAECNVARADSPTDAARGQQVVLTCVGNDQDLAEVALGEGGALAAMDRGALFVDHTTVSPAAARQVAQEAARLGVLALDAPVSGGQAGAENARLVTMCGGSAEAMERALPVFAAYAARVVHIGDAGAGQSAKAVNQICIAGVLAGVSEAMRLAQSQDLPMDKVLEAVSGGSGQSWQLENRWATMAAGEFDFGFAVDWMRKDLGIALATAHEAGLSLPITALIDQFYAAVQARGGGRQDTSALIRHLPDPA